MKLLFMAMLPFMLLSAASAQTAEKNLNTITVLGYAKLPLKSNYYKAFLFIQEEETKVGYATVGKSSIDSIRQTLFTSLKKFGIDEKDVSIAATSSRELGQYPGFLINNMYECKIKSKELAAKLVNEMRFAGLKGVIIKTIFTAEEKEKLAEVVYNEAIADAKKTAVLLAAKANKTVGEIKSIDVTMNAVSTIGTDYETDNFNAYSYSRFEMDFREKQGSVNVRVVFEIK